MVRKKISIRRSRSGGKSKFSRELIPKLTNQIVEIARLTLHIKIEIDV